MLLLLLSLLSNFVSALTSCPANTMTGYSIIACSMYGSSGSPNIHACNKGYPSQPNDCCCDVDCNGVEVGNQQCGPPACSECGSQPSCYSRSTYYLDNDSDGYYTGSTSSACSAPGTGWTSTVKIAGDCNDNNNSVRPNATETCNGVDDNCDGLIDEGNVCSTCNIVVAKNNNLSFAVSYAKIPNFGGLVNITYLDLFNGGKINSTTTAKADFFILGDTCLDYPACQGITASANTLIRVINSSELSLLTQLYNSGMSISLMGDNGPNTTVYDASNGTRTITNNLTKFKYNSSIVFRTINTYTPNYITYPFLQNVIFNYSYGSGTPGYMTNVSAANCVDAHYGLNNCTVAYIPANGTNGSFMVNGDAGTGSEIYLFNMISAKCGFAETCNGIDDDGNGLIDENGICGCINTSKQNQVSIENLIFLNNSGLIAYWPFDSVDGSNSTNAVEIISGRNGTVVKSSLVPGIVGDAYNFSTPAGSIYGTENYIVAPTTPFDASWNRGYLAGKNNFTVSFFAKFNSTNSGTFLGEYLFRFDRNPIYTDGSWYLQYASNNLVFNYDRATTLSVPFTPTINKWYSIIVSREGNNFNFYVDGTKLNNFSIGTIPNGNGIIYFGTIQETFLAGGFGCQDSDCPQHYDVDSDFRGSLDEISIWNRTLSDCEIKKLALGPSGCLNICVPKNCTGPDSSNIINGASRIYFSAATAPYGSVCQNETRVCNDGELYGSYTASSCIVLPPSNCTGPDSSNIIHTQNKTYFLQSSVTYGNVCLSETRVCSDGNLTGSYTSPTCAVSVPILNCSVSATDADSDSVTYNYEWYSVDENNGQLVYIVDSNLLSLASIAEYESGAIYVCKVYANDGEENSLVGYKSLSFNKDKTYVPYGNIESEVTQIGAYSPNNKIPREVNVATKSNFSYESNVDCTNGECGDLNSDVVYTLEDLLPLTPPFNKLFFEEGLFGSLMRKTGSLLFLADSPFNFSTELYAKIYSQYSEVENSTYGNYTIKGDGMMYKYDEKCSAYYTPVFKSYAYVTYKNGSVDIIDADSANEITYSLNINDIIVKSYLFYYLQTGQVVNVSVDAATIISSSNHVAINYCNGIADNCLIHNYNSSNYANYPMSSTVTSTFDLAKFNLVVNNSCLLSNIADVDKQFKFRVNLGNDPVNLTANGFNANICTAGSISELGIPNYLGLVYAYGNPGNLYSDAGIVSVNWNTAGLNAIFSDNSKSSSFRTMFDLNMVNVSGVVSGNNISAIKLTKSSSYNDVQFKGLFQGMSVPGILSLPIIVSYTSNSGIVLSKAVSFDLNFSNFNFTSGSCFPPIPPVETCDGIDNNGNGEIDEGCVNESLSCYYSLLNSGSSYRYWRNDNKGSVDVQETCYNATGTSVYTGIVDSTRVNFTQLSGSVGGITFLAGIDSAPSQGCSNIVSTSNNKCYQVNTAGTYNVLINVLNGTHNGYNVTYYNSNSLNFIVNANCAFANGESLNVNDSRFEANLDPLNPYHLMTGSSFDVENVSLSCLGGVPADNNELYNKYCLAPHNVKNASDLFDSTKYPDVSFSILSTNNSLLYYSGVGATANVASCRDLTVLTVKSNFELDVSTLSYCSAKLETSVDFALPDVTRRNTYCSASQGDDGNGNAIEYTFIRNHLIAYAKESNSTAAYAYGSNADDVYDFFIHTLNNDEVKLYFNSLTKGFQDYRDSGFDNIEKTITPFSDVFTNESLLGEFLPKIIGFENITSEGNLLPPVVQQSDNKEFNSLYSVKKQYLKNIYSTSNEQLNFTKTSVEFAGNLSKMTKLNLTKVCYAEADKFRLKKGYKLDFELVNACPKLLISIIFDPGFYISLKGDNNYCYVDYKKDDYACCNTENSCVYDGKCYAPNSLMNTTYGVGDNDLLQEQCIIY